MPICKNSIGQEIVEFIIGTTVTRVYKDLGCSIRKECCAAIDCYDKNPLKPYCVKNKCVEKPGYGEECIYIDNLSTCHTDLYCKKNSSQDQVLSQIQAKGVCRWLDNVRPLNYSCDKNSNCKDNYFCKNKICSKGDDGDPCTRPNICKSNICYQGKCLRKREINETCNNDDFYCKSNICIQNKCKNTMNLGDACGNKKCGANCNHHCTPLHCKNNICSKKPVGSFCNSGPLECLSGMCVDRKCSKLRKEGETCGETACAGMSKENNCDYQCEGELICLNYKCAKKRDIGESCDNDSHCIHDKCHKKQVSSSIFTENALNIINTVAENFKGVCVAKPGTRELRQSCTLDNECITNNCSEGLCYNRLYSKNRCEECKSNIECKSGYCKDDFCQLNKGTTDSNSSGKGKCKMERNKELPLCDYCKYGYKTPLLSSDIWCCHEGETGCTDSNQIEGGQYCEIPEVSIVADNLSLNLGDQCSEHKQCITGYCKYKTDVDKFVCVKNPGSKSKPYGEGKCGEIDKPSCDYCKNGVTLVGSQNGVAIKMKWIFVKKLKE